MTPKRLQISREPDWHAQLDPVSINGANVGGAAQISSYWKKDRAANPNTLTLTAGDAYGASPPLSTFFNEEPAVKAMNLMGFDVDTFGNHNFDRGVSRLHEIIDLADFQYVSTNLRNLDANLSGVKPFEIFEVGGVKAGVIGVTNLEAPTLVVPGASAPSRLQTPYRLPSKPARPRKGPALRFSSPSRTWASGAPTRRPMSRSGH